MQWVDSNNKAKYNWDINNQFLNMSSDVCFLKVSAFVNCSLSDPLMFDMVWGIVYISCSILS